MPTDSILNHIRRLGYAVSTHRVNGTVEMHAVKLDGSEAPQIARCDDGDEFSSGVAPGQAVFVLRALGFNVVRMADDWTETEVTQIVYLAMVLATTCSLSTRPMMVRNG